MVFTRAGEGAGRGGLRGRSALRGLISGSRERWPCCEVRRTAPFPVGPAGVTGSRLGFWEMSPFLWVSRHPPVLRQAGRGESVTFFFLSRLTHSTPLLHSGLAPTSRLTLLPEALTSF